MHSLVDLLEEYDAASTFSLALADGLDPTDLFWRPNTESSSMAWHLGHQGAVSHYMLRNLTAAEVTFNADFDAVFDSATPEPGRGELPPIDEIIDYRKAISESVHKTIAKIDQGDVGAPEQLNLIATGLMQAVINHEYQHAKWVGEVRETMTTQPSPVPASTNLVNVEGYWMVTSEKATS